jgi:hypothetical protein
MRVGVTGHQERQLIDWHWVEAAIRKNLAELRPIESCLSSLAAGSDQIFAEVALSLGIPVSAVIPVKNYDRFFRGPSYAKYRDLLKECAVVQLNPSGSDQHAFLEAGRKIVEMTDLMFAVWDGKPAEGEGGTGDIVSFARHQKRRILHINPSSKIIAWME